MNAVQCALLLAGASPEARPGVCAGGFLAAVAGGAEAAALGAVVGSKQLIEPIVLGPYCTAPVAVVALCTTVNGRNK